MREKRDGQGGVGRPADKGAGVIHTVPANPGLTPFLRSGRVGSSGQKGKDVALYSARMAGGWVVWTFMGGTGQYSRLQMSGFAISGPALLKFVQVSSVAVCAVPNTSLEADVVRARIRVWVYCK